MIQTDKIYQILKILADNMNFERFDIDKISPQKLKITKSMWDQLIVMLNESGYIKGVVITEFIDGSTDINIDKIKQNDNRKRGKAKWKAWQNST